MTTSYMIVCANFAFLIQVNIGDINLNDNVKH